MNSYDAKKNYLSLPSVNPRPLWILQTYDTTSRQQQKGTITRVDDSVQKDSEYDSSFSNVTITRLKSSTYVDVIFLQD